MSKNRSKLEAGELMPLRFRPGCDTWQDVLFEEVWRRCEEMGRRDSYSFLLRLLDRLGCEEDARMATRVYSVIEREFADELRAMLGRAA